MFKWEFTSPENVNKIYFDSLKLSHCNFEAVTFNSIPVFFLYFYLSTSNVTSSSVIQWFQMMSFSWILVVMSVIYNILSQDIPSRVWHIKTYVHALLVLIISRQSKPRKTVLCLSLYLIDKSGLSNSLFYNIKWLAQLCFTRFILDSRDSRKWIIASLNRLVHWKIEFQSLRGVIQKFILGSGSR